MDNLMAYDQFDTDFKPGDRIELISTTDPYTDLKPGDQGVVDHIDDLGNIHIRWDSGSGLAMIPGEDHIKKI